MTLLFTCDASKKQKNRAKTLKALEFFLVITWKWWKTHIYIKFYIIKWHENKEICAKIWISVMLKLQKKHTFQIKYALKSYISWNKTS